MRIGLAGGVLALMLAGCGGVLPRESEVDSKKFQTYDQVLASYGDVNLGRTHVNDLPAIGFDTKTTPNIEVLSYAEIVDRFLPSETITMEHLPKSVQQCIEAQYHCSAYVFHLRNSHTEHSSSVVPDLLEIERDTVKRGWSADVVLLVQDDLVVYKVISGSPNSEDQHDRSQPLGPFQDIITKTIHGSPQD
jgi:hypothetical protein